MYDILMDDRYGDQAGEVTDKSLRTAGNVTGLVLVSELCPTFISALIGYYLQTYANWKKLGIR